MRLIVLGASNIAIHLPALAAAARRRWSGPLEIAVACGHGRSYGQTNRVLFRSLPGILHCGLWEYLQACPAPDPRGLVTDVGNDLLYGQKVPTIVGWVEQCLQRLASHGARITLVGPPVAGIRTLPRSRYYAFRRVFFPGATLGWEEAIERTGLLAEGLQALAERHPAVRYLEPSAQWYAADPIHIRRAAARLAMQAMTESLPGGSIEAPSVESGALRAWERATNWWLLRSRAPHQRGMWGRWRITPQPCAQLHGGVIVSLF